MKKCYQCNKTYDDSWGVCLECSAPLNATAPGENPEPEKRKIVMPFGDSFIEEQIKRSNRNLLLINLCVIAGMVFLMVSTASEAGYYVLLYLGIFILAVWNVIKFWRRSKNSLLHPINLTIAKLGPCEKITPVINQEVKNAKLYINSTIITESWLFKPTTFGLQMMLLGELVWTHKKVTSRSYYGIPTGKEFAVIVYKRDGKTLEVSCSENNSTSLIEEIVKSAPWVVVGYDDKIQKLWDSDRNGFIEYVNQRRREANTSKS